MVNIPTWARTFTLHNPIITTSTPNLLGYRHRCENCLKFFYYGKTDIADNSVQFNSIQQILQMKCEIPVHSSPHRRLQKCAARVLIRPDVYRWITPVRYSCFEPATHEKFCCCSFTACFYLKFV